MISNDLSITGRICVLNDLQLGKINPVLVPKFVGGSSNTKTVKDGDYFKIDAPPERIASGLQIVKAQYGYEGNYADVTDAVQNHLPLYLYQPKHPAIPLLHNIAQTLTEI
jgi:hypothetical protein